MATYSVNVYMRRAGATRYSFVAAPAMCRGILPIPLDLP